MEMSESALRHIMDTQTQMLQNLTRLQEQQSRGDLTNNLTNVQSAAQAINQTGTQLNTPPLEIQDNHIQTPLNETIKSPVAPPIASPGLPVSNMAVADPTAYGTVAAIPVSGGRQESESGGGGLFAEQGFIGGTIAEFRDFDPSRHSREATAEFFSEQTRGIQEQGVNFLTGAASGAASAGAMFVPGGLLASMAVGTGVAVGVGAVASDIRRGATTALDYQEILQRNDYKFINAFESTDEMGGIGMGLGQRQEMSSWLRDFAVDQYLSDPDLQRILEGASQNSLLKSVSDVDSFKKKFSEIVGAVKDITVSLNATLEEATEFMGEMERRGVSTQNMSNIAAGAKVMSSFTGTSATQGAQAMMNVSDAVVAGTGIAADDIMQSAGYNITSAQLLQDSAKAEGNEELYHFIKNAGGATGFGAAYEQDIRGYAASQQGANMLQTFFGTAFSVGENGQVEYDANRMSELLQGNYNANQLEQMSTSYLASLSTDQRFAISQQAGEIFSGQSSQEIAAFLNRGLGLVQESNPAVTEQSFMMMQGITDNYAQATAYAEMLERTGDPNEMSRYGAAVLKEEMDSHAIATNPSLMKRLRFGVERLRNPIGDVGQYGSDLIGQQMQNYQQWVTGIDDRSMVGGQLDFEYSQAGLNRMIDRMEEYSGDDSALNTGAAFFNRQAKRDLRSGDIAGAAQSWLNIGDWGSQGRYDADNLRAIAGNVNVDGFSGGTVDAYMSKIESGDMGFAEIAGVARRMRNDESLDFFDRQRAKVVTNAARGDYESFGGKVAYGVIRGGIGAADWAWENTFGEGEESDLNMTDLNLAGSDMTMKNLGKLQEDLADERKDLQKETAGLFKSDSLDNLSDEELKELESAVMAGKLGKVGELTDDEDIYNVAKQYKELGKAEKDLSGQMGDYDMVVRQTKAVNTAAVQLGDLFNAAGVYDESTIETLLGDAVERNEKTTKKIKKGKMTTEQMIESIAVQQAEYDTIFENLDDERLNTLANYFEDRDQSFNIQAFTKEDGTIKADKLQEYVMNTFRSQQTTVNETGDGKEDSVTEEAGKAAQQHKDAMYSFLTAYQEESQMIRDALDGVPVRYNQTTPSQG